MPAMRRPIVPLCLLALALCSPAAADTLACFAEGQRAIQADDFAVAADAFAAAADRAECAATRSFLLFNAAVALDKRAAGTDDDDPAHCRALGAYRAAAEEATEETRPAIEDGVRRLGRACPPSGALRIVCTPAGGTVALVGVPLSRPCPAQFDDLRPRRYRGTVTAAGRVVPFEVDVPSGQRIEHSVSLEDPAPLATAPTPVEPAPRLAPYGWAAVGLAAVGAGVATYAWFEGDALVDEQAGLDRASDGQPLSDEALRSYEAESARIEGDHGTMKTLHLVSVIASGALLAGGITLLVLDDPSPAVEGEVGAAQVFLGPVSGVRITFGP